MSDFYVNGFIVDEESGMLRKDTEPDEHVHLSWMSSVFSDSEVGDELEISSLVLSEFGNSFRMRRAKLYHWVEIKCVDGTSTEDLFIDGCYVATLWDLQDLRLKIAYRLGDFYVLVYTGAAGRKYNLTILLSIRNELEGYLLSPQEPHVRDMEFHNFIPKIPRPLLARLKLSGFPLE